MTQPLPASVSPGFAAWLWRTAGLRLGWGELGAAVVVGVGLAIVGGMPAHPMYHFASRATASAWLLAIPQFGLPLVLALQGADRAVERGRSALLAYGAVVPLVILAGACLLWRPFWPWLAPWGSFDRSPDLLQCIGEGSRLWLPVTLGVVAYAHWRQQQRSERRIAQRRLQLAERRQQMQAAALLSLQARLEPPLLFDTLGRVARLAGTDPAAAESLLTELIALLRAMLPEPQRPGSTVEREFALVRAYGKVIGEAALLPPALVLHTTLDAAQATLAPMVLLPLLRALAAAGPGGVWQLAAQRPPAGGAGLQLSLRARPGGASVSAAALRGLAGSAQAQARSRLAAVHGAGVTVELQDTDDAPHWLIDIPAAHAPRTDR